MSRRTVWAQLLAPVAIVSVLVAGADIAASASPQHSLDAGADTSVNAQVAANTAKADSMVAPRVGATGVFRIINRLSGKCLTQWGSGDGVAITQVSCNAADSYQWWRLDTGSVGPISNYGSGKCLDLWGNHNANAQVVYLWGCYGALGQQWRLVHKELQYYELRPHYTDKCLDLAANSTADGAVMQQWGCNWGYNANQQWWIG